jgi:hypothetical protein
MRYDVATNPPWVTGPLAPDNDNESVEWRVYVAYAGTDDHAFEARCRTAFEKYATPGWDELEFDLATTDTPHVFATGKVLDDAGNYEADGNPVWLADFAEDIGAEVQP